MKGGTEVSIWLPDLYGQVIAGNGYNSIPSILNREGG